MEKFVCPVCKKEVEGLEALNNCVNTHIKEEEVNKEKERLRDIEILKTANDKLVEQIRRNNKKLAELGIAATVSYNVFSCGHTSIKSPIYQNKIFKDIDEKYRNGVNPTEELLDMLKKAIEEM